MQNGHQEDEQCLSNKSTGLKIHMAYCTFLWVVYEIFGVRISNQGQKLDNRKTRIESQFKYNEKHKYNFSVH